MLGAWFADELATMLQGMPPPLSQEPQRWEHCLPMVLCGVGATDGEGDGTGESGQVATVWDELLQLREPDSNGEG
jgi:hypothetical protein